MPYTFCLHRFMLALCLIACMFSLPTPVAAKNAYRIATTTWVGWSPLDVAKALNFWEEEGISVELIRYHGGPVLEDTLRAGKVDLSCNMVGDVAGMHNQGTPMTILAEVDWSHGGDALIAHKDLDIQAHTGGILGVYYNAPASWYFIHKSLQQKGSDFKNFRRVELTPQDLIAQFVAGRIPLVHLYDPYAQQAIHEGNGVTIATTADFEGSLPECIYGTQKRIKSIPPEDLRAILCGWIRAVEWLQNTKNWHAYARILTTRTLKGTGLHTDEQLREYVSNVRIHTPQMLKNRNKRGGGLDLFLRDLHTFMKENNEIKYWKNPLELQDTSYILDVLQTYSSVQE